MGEEHGMADLLVGYHCDESLRGGRNELSAAGRRVPTRETTTAPGRLSKKEQRPLAH
jgi:hypothetical protein